MPALGVLFGQPVGARVSSIIKPADQTVATGTTPEADDDLWFDTEPASVYLIELTVIGSTTSSNSVRYFFSHGGTTTYFPPRATARRTRTPKPRTPPALRWGT